MSLALRSGLLMGKFFFQSRIALPPEQWLRKMSDGYEHHPHDEVVADQAAAIDQPSANATWSLTDLRHGFSNWSLASDSGVRFNPS